MYEFGITSESGDLLMKLGEVDGFESAVASARGLVFDGRQCEELEKAVTQLYGSVELPLKLLVTVFDKETFTKQYYYDFNFQDLRKAHSNHARTLN